MPRTCPFQPPPPYAKLRAEEPAARVTLQDGSTTWLLTRHADVRTVLSSRAVSSDRARPGFPATVANVGAFAQKGFLLSMDAPEHAMHRKLVTNEFTVQRIRALRPRIQEIVDERITRMLKSPTREADLVQALALPVPSLVICELLGVPYDTRDVFQRHAEILLDRSTPAEERGRSFGALRTFFGELVASRAAEDTDADSDDLLGRLMTKYREHGTFDQEVMTGFVMLLLIAGHETTANMIGLGVAALLDRPEDLAGLRAGPDRMPQAVEELLRYFSIVDYPTARVALEDIDLGHTRIRAGEGVIAAAAAANHDESVFDRPDVLDLDRNPRGHVAFGFGPHQCLGQNLARAELDITYRTLFDRVPTLRLAHPVADLAFKDASVYGLQRLDVTW
ncbi:cytochrome P450 [Streptomyces sp. NPDC052051]|uniref:cytochrome P450 n=1 Tax=Streptomyces sp. NPDC052051 TaxID=3154649 RepID=UPI0034347E86